MHVDHLVFAAGPEGLQATAERLSKVLGEQSRDGGFHPRFGTRNRLIPLADDRYVEIVEVLEHPVAEKAPFGQVVRARSEAGGGWLGWVLSVDDLAPYEERLGREAVDGSRHFPDGRLLEWKQIGVKGLMADPQVPFFLKWISEESVRPKALDGRVELIRLELAGDKARVEEWIGGRCEDLLGNFEIEWIAPNGQPGIVAAHFRTDSGKIRV
ncbi:VOC family protein [Naumannella sp. ID2617S]|uniref:Glycosyltransferase n=1 Tax=Enemella dayhoffiae TaxID=2016507 RepID=A0A255H7S3_9ACTN|nr:VOC family protein [Enemella dayhoffiae]NNG20810.1 VOC family protein [Naumannella sp. ID2617S]OYO22774.1 glycosyltransferase [Enemella dayhoffiae]